MKNPREYSVRWTRWKAILFSCLLYFAPISYFDFNARTWLSVLLAPQWADPFGKWIWIAYLTLGIAIQSALGIGFYHLFRGTTRPKLTGVIAAALGILSGVPLSMGGVWLDARIVPALYRDVEPAPVDWKEACRVESAFLLTPARPRFGSLEAAARAWIVSHPNPQPLLLTPENCATLAFPQQVAMSSVIADRFKPASAEGEAIRFTEHVGFRYAWFQARERSLYQVTWLPLDDTQIAPAGMVLRRQFSPGGCVAFRMDPFEQRELPSHPHSFCPLQAEDSKTIASLEGTAYSTTERSVQFSDHEPVSVAAAGPGFLSINSLSMSARRLLVKRQTSSELEARSPDLDSSGFTHEFAEIGFDGRVLWRLPRTGEPEDSGFIVHSTDWVWWHTNPHPGIRCCELEWSVSGRRQVHRVARGREIVSVSFHPERKLVAVSVTDRHNTGSVQDSIYVLRTADGAEVFRHYGAPATRSRVQFLGADRLVYTGFHRNSPFVRVVEIPPAAGH